MDYNKIFKKLQTKVKGSKLEDVRYEVKLLKNHKFLTKVIVYTKGKVYKVQKTGDSVQGSIRDALKAVSSQIEKRQKMYSHTTHKNRDLIFVREFEH